MIKAAATSAPPRRFPLPISRGGSVLPEEHLDSWLSRWEDEGGALDPYSQGRRDSEDSAPKLPRLTPAEWEHLRSRVIALENLLVAILSDASDRQRELGRAMAVYIFPRPGFTCHSPTIGAASQMIRLIDRAEYFVSLGVPCE